MGLVCERCANGVDVDISFFDKDSGGRDNTAVAGRIVWGFQKKWQPEWLPVV